LSAQFTNIFTQEQERELAQMVEQNLIMTEGKELAPRYMMA
jgi:hypothetical protein